MTVQDNVRDERSRIPLQLLIDSTGEGIYSLDLAGRCTFINKAGAAALGWTPEAVLGKRMHMLTHHRRPDGSFYPSADCPILESCRSGRSCRVDDEVFWRQDGSAFPVSYSSSPILDDGTVTGAVVTFVDVTEKKKLEARLQQAQRLEAVGQLTGGVAHDFNNLLTVVLGSVEALLDRLPPGDPNRTDVEEIRQAGRSAAALTRQLQAFSRQQVLLPVILDLNTVVRAVEKLLRRVIGEDVSLSITLDQELRKVHADPHQIEQVLVNLAMNARHAMPDGGALTIETRNDQRDRADASHPNRQPGGYVALTVTDDGCGMSNEVKSHIFEPFFTTRERGSGTGLGLATVLGIVEQSGGFIDVDTAVGRGSTFKISLPHVAADDSRSPTPAPQSSLRHGTEVVLLVEDEPSVRARARTGLERAGYTVHAVGSAEEALALGAADVDLLVTDVVLPGTDGCRLATELTAGWPGLKVLYMSGHTGDTFLGRKGLKAGEAFLGKPFTPRELAQKVRDVLDT